MRIKPAPVYWDSPVQYDEIELEEMDRQMNLREENPGCRTCGRPGYDRCPECVDIAAGKMKWTGGKWVMR